MKNLVEALLEDDHESLGRLLTKLDSELAKPNLSVAFELLDLFWARLAVHIRAENLHLFPALANSSSLFTGSGGLPAYTQAQSVLDHLRSDHDFFMKELADMIKAMREMVGSNSSHREEIADLQRRMMVIASSVRRARSLNGTPAARNSRSCSTPMPKAGSMRPPER